jgi:hypothetical protein
MILDTTEELSIVGKKIELYRAMASMVSTMARPDRELLSKNRHPYS